MIEQTIDSLIELPFPLIQLSIGIIGGLLIFWVSSILLNITISKAHNKDLEFFKNRCWKTIRIFTPVLTTYIALQYGENSAWLDGLRITFRILLLITSGYLIIKFTYWLEDIFLERYNIEKEDNRKERKIITQLNFLKKVVIVTISIITFSIILLSFEEGRKYGQTILTSAGVASVIIGFAAQKTLANFLAGIQIAFTQPIKLDDAVLVENEWGWIEEINLTYVVVRIWDWRRLVLPITYFIEKPFQNWTRNKGEIIGAVVFYLDYRTPVDKLRAKLVDVLENEPNWDGQVKALQVIDTKEYLIVVRALMSAKNSPMAWDLRCSVREKLIAYLKDEYPESLPSQRLLVDTGVSNESD